MPKMRLLYAFWVLLLLCVVLLAVSARTDTSTIFGITESQELVISSESAVEVRRLHVVLGQAVKEGDLLVELANPDLEIKINSATQNLAQARAQKAVSRDQLRSQVDQLKADRQTRINQLNYEIERLRVQYSISRDLTEKMTNDGVRRDGAKKPADDASNPYRQRLESLQRELESTEKSYAARIDLLDKTLATSDDPAKAQAALYERELALLTAERGRLRVVATFSGRIGSVNVKGGEKVSPFTALLTVHTQAPIYVKGYVHEFLYHRVVAGAPVLVVSISDSAKRVRGEVVGVGSRIVEFPVRMRIRPDISVWGREVLVRIAPANEFLLGEKVRILPTGQVPPANAAQGTRP